MSAVVFLLAWSAVTLAAWYGIRNLCRGVCKRIPYTIERRGNTMAEQSSTGTESGQTAAEYAVCLSVITLVTVVAIHVLSLSVVDIVQALTNTIPA